MRFQLAELVDVSEIDDRCVDHREARDRELAAARAGIASLILPD